MGNKGDCPRRTRVIARGGGGLSAGKGGSRCWGKGRIARGKGGLPAQGNEENIYYLSFFIHRSNKTLPFFFGFRLLIQQDPLTLQLLPLLF